MWNLEDNHIVPETAEQMAVRDLTRSLYDNFALDDSEDEELERADQDIEEEELAEPEVAGA